MISQVVKLERLLALTGSRSVPLIKMFLCHIFNQETVIKQFSHTVKMEYVFVFISGMRIQCVN